MLSRHFIAVLALVTPLASATGQRAGRAPVHLSIRPQVGDTIRSQVTQQTDVTISPASRTGASRTTTSRVQIASRSIVRDATPTSTTVLTIVDSVNIVSSDEHAARRMAEAQRSLAGQQLVLSLASDGSVEHAEGLDGAPVAPDMAEAIASMPAVLPRRALVPGDEWTREMAVPERVSGAPGAAQIDATFRLDSLSADARHAFITMRGVIRDKSPRDAMQTSGSITGTMRIDRVRGWMTESRFLITLRSLMTPPDGSGFAPMRIITRVTQQLRTLDKR